jgi:hypothetical protein
VVEQSKTCLCYCVTIVRGVLGARAPRKGAQPSLQDHVKQFFSSWFGLWRHGLISCVPGLGTHVILSARRGFNKKARRCKSSKSKTVLERPALQLQHIVT